MTDERLSDLEEAAWGGFLNTHTRLWRTLESRLAPTGVTMAEYDVLAALEAAGDEGVRMSDLAARRLMSTGGFTRMADRLEKQGLIVRQRSAMDGRGLNAVITPAGRERLGRARRSHLEDVRALFLARLEPAELEQLHAIWKRLADEGPDARC
ncbi:DNA-binding MarR family transcriptional regulator [Catenuloplanes nepalensis]|uniref:DNA-binding MarR family transcriptional regulator n=1 Tax=Catenuloplanes nepalensis TaxID=587533 RepID=A0ABT9MTW6_9ACTN|nr:MarR family transcriptional regulator [Catenuloplanes nepalensis]MDP9794875.1 DNA-binding MarR family transcriptional regulator [Catenuloplanes nepalensis]